MAYNVPVEVTTTEEVVGADGNTITKTKTSFQFQTETKNSFLLEPRAVIRFAIPAEKVQFKSVDGKILDKVLRSSGTEHFTGSAVTVSSLMKSRSSYLPSVPLL